MISKNNFFSQIVFNVLLTLVSVKCVASVPFQDQTSSNSTFELILLHNNDMHARFEQIDKNSNTCGAEDIKANRCYGGFARVSHLVKKYRKQAESGGTAVLYLNGGDTYYGSNWFSAFKHKVSSEFMNLLQPDAMVRTTKQNKIKQSILKI